MAEILSFFGFFGENSICWKKIRFFWEKFDFLRFFEKIRYFLFSQKNCEKIRFFGKKNPIFGRKSDFFWQKLDFLEENPIFCQ
jgi:hypothetical protein